MMLPDGHRWVVVVKRDGVVIELVGCAGKHLVPASLWRLQLAYLGQAVQIVSHQVALRLVKTTPDAPELASGDAS